MKKYVFLLKQHEQLEEVRYFENFSDADTYYTKRGNQLCDRGEHFEMKVVDSSTDEVLESIEF